MRLSARIFVAFLACAIPALAAIAWYSNHSVRAFYQREIAAELGSRASLIARELEPCFSASHWNDVDLRCKEFGRLTHTRMTVILPDGRVIGDSDHDPSRMENHSDRPEIADALRGLVGNSIRFSDTARRRMMYLAIPVHQQGRIAGVVRASVPVAVIDWTLRRLYWDIAAGVAVVAAIFGAAALFVARRITRPLDDMRRTAERLAAGDLRSRAAVPSIPEMAALARSLNGMAAQLAERMETITRRTDQQKAVLSSMVEGVLAISEDGKILDMNPAAANLLEAPAGSARGRNVLEIVRNPDLQEFVTATLDAGGTGESEIVFYGREERHLQVRGTVLKTPDDRKLGILVVLHDITRMKKLEEIRRDFVANVSHELKTPITAIKGCLDTLSEQKNMTAEEQSRFLAMMGRQVERLNAIVEDLLSLSRIEHDAEQKRIALEPGSICDVLRRAGQAFARAAEAKGMVIAVECPSDLTAPINAPLLEQAVGNLIDNAIKYSGEHTQVVVEAALRGNAVEIRVADQGPGIEKKHLARIFERFYRVDQARSRSLGGTGLGLAIVKHIVLAHGGEVSVESTPSKGSVFTIRIPRQS